MGVIQVESFDVDVTNDGEQYTLTNSIGSTTKAFLRNMSSRSSSLGPVGSTSNAGPDEFSMGATLVNLLSPAINFSKSNSVTQKYVGEVWRYTGAAGGIDEFKTRQSVALTISDGQSSASTSISGIVDRNKCVPFINGKQSSQTNQNDFNEFMGIAYINSSNQLVVDRDSTVGTTTYYVTVVEFTGASWQVGHMRAPFGTAARTMYEDSEGTSGTVFDCGSWGYSSILSQFVQGDTGNDALEDTVAGFEPGSFPTQVAVFTDPGSACNADVMCHVVSNSNMVVGRWKVQQTISNNNTYVNFGVQNSNLSSLDESCLEFSVTTDGSGTAFGRGTMGARLTSTAGLETWAHRSGNSGNFFFGGVDLSSLTNTVSPVIFSINQASILGTTTGIELSGLFFGSSTGVLVASDNPVFGAGTISTQTPITWSDTLVTFDFNPGSLSQDQNIYFWLTNTTLGANAAISVFFGQPPYSVILEQLSIEPDHAWGFDGEYTERMQGLNIPTLTVGSPGFAALPITRGRTQSFTIPDATSRIESADTGNMNLSAKTKRSMGGWVRFDRVQKEPVCFYEEGGGVNNLCFLMGNGGTLIAQLADTGDDNVHAYSDFKLRPNRDYHIYFGFDYTLPNAADRQFRLWIDGVKQTSTFGNPLTSNGGHLDSHSGDIVWGGYEGSLEVFGTNVNFNAVVQCYYNDWVTFSGVLPEAELRSEVFEKGVRASFFINSGTESEMQAVLDTISNSVLPNQACDILVDDCTDGAFTLLADNVVHNPFSSINIQFVGTGSLTWINANGSNAALVSSPYGGNVTLVNPSTLRITGLQDGSEVRVLEASTENEVAGIESVTGGEYFVSIQEPLVDISIISLGFQNIKLKGVDMAGDRTIPVQQALDRQYFND